MKVRNIGHGWRRREREVVVDYPSWPYGAYRVVYTNRLYPSYYVARKIKRGKMSAPVLVVLAGTNTVVDGGANIEGCFRRIYALAREAERASVIPS